MKSFRFPLEKALELRRTQLELEEANHKRQIAAVAAIDRRKAEIEASGVQAEIEVRQWSPIQSGDLAALGHYRLKVKSEESALARHRLDAVQKLAAQQKVMMFMPLMFGFMFYSASSGLVLYWLTGNVVNIAQQWFFNRTAVAADVAQSVQVTKKKNGRK